MSNQFFLKGGRKYATIVLSMGVKIEGDATKIGKNTHLSVLMCVSLLKKIGLHNLTNWTQFKIINF